MTSLILSLAWGALVAQFLIDKLGWELSQPRFWLVAPPLSILGGALVGYYLPA